MPKRYWNSVLVLLSLVLFESLGWAASAVAIVPGTSDPWLAGMPNASTASLGDIAPAQSPVQVTGFTITPGASIYFSATGGVCNFACAPFPPDGSGLFGHTTGAENGISDITAPLNSLLGVFLDASQPSLSAPPGPLSYTIDDLTFAPALKQVFFIGDGFTSGAVQQRIVVPAGATRLFLGTMDGSGWFNNTGALNVTVSDSTSTTCGHHTVHGHISTVPPTHSGIPDTHLYGHTVHGHVVTVDCPPHAPGHTPGLSRDAEEGFFSSNASSVGPDFVAAVNSEGRLGPAKRGEHISLFGSARGLYLDERDAQSAANFTPPAAGTPLYYTTSGPQIRIGGAKAKVLFSGLAPGLTGVWQINALVPEGISVGKLPVEILYEGDELKSIDLEVQ